MSHWNAIGPRDNGECWNHKRVYRIYRELELNLRIKPRKRLKRDKPEALEVPEAANDGPWISWLIDLEMGASSAC